MNEWTLASGSNPFKKSSVTGSRCYALGIPMQLKSGLQSGPRQSEGRVKVGAVLRSSQDCSKE